MPQKFKDNKGNEYTLTLTLGRAREVRSKLALDILNEQDWTQLMCSLADRLAYVWWLVVDQCVEKQVTLDAFEMNLQGEGIADGCSDAFMEELSDFFRRYGQHQLEVMTVEAFRALKTAREKFADPRAGELLRSELDKVLTKADRTMAVGLDMASANGAAL